MPAGKVVPGVEVIWTVTANNICKQPSDKVTINNAVPGAHDLRGEFRRRARAATSRYSLDGKTLRHRRASSRCRRTASTRQARADEYKHIRWVFKNSLQPGATAFARFRAVLN